MASTLETNIATSTVLVADMVPVLMKEKLLSLADKQLVFFEIGDKEDLPTGNGKTIQFTRYERLVLPFGPLSESITPDAAALTTSVVQAVVDQWGAIVSMSDVAELTIKHPVMQIAQNRLGKQHAETVDREVQKTLLGSSNVSFANGRSARSSLIAGDVVSTDDIRKIVAQLRSDGAPSMDDGSFIGVFDPFVEMDLTKDATFTQAASYSNLRSLLNAEVGMWMGVRWKRSNFIPIITRHTGETINANATLNNFTGFALGTTNKARITKLDANTGFETAIGDETNVTNGGAAFRVRVITPAVAGTYNVYCSLESGAAGTATFQTRVVSTGSAITVNIAKALGTGTIVTTGATLELVVSATGAVSVPDTSTAGNVHITWVFGKEAFGVVDLNGLKTTLTPPSASDSDPLVQRRKAGWKQMFKCVIKNTTFFRRLESLSNFN